MAYVYYNYGIYYICRKYNYVKFPARILLTRTTSNFPAHPVPERASQTGDRINNRAAISSFYQAADWFTRVYCLLQAEKPKTGCHDFVSGERILSLRNNSEPLCLFTILQITR